MTWQHSLPTRGGDIPPVVLSGWEGVGPLAETMIFFLHPYYRYMKKNGLAFLLILHSVILQFYNVTGFKYALPRCNAECRFRWERNIFSMKLCPSSRWSCSSKRSTLINTIQSQHCITLVQRWTNVFDVGTTLYKCYTNVLCLLGYVSFIAGDNIVFLWWDDARWAVGTCCRTTRCNQAANLWPRS